MLYQMHEFQQAAITPMRVMAQAMYQFYSHPLLPTSYTRLARSMAAGADVFERVTRRYIKPTFGLKTTTVNGAEAEVHESTQLCLPFCNLLHFERWVDGQPAGTDQPTVLVVAPLSGHYATLLRGTVEALLPDHQVYITDWANARDVSFFHGPFALADYVDYVRILTQFLGPNVHVLGVCQPSVPVLAAASLMAEDGDPSRPASMTLMGGPIDTRINPTTVNQYAESKPFSWFEENVVHTVPVAYHGRGRRVYPGFLQLSGFMSMNMDRHMDAHLRYYRHLIQGDGDSAEQHRQFYDEYLSVMDLPGEFYLETVNQVFQEHLLPRGGLEVHGRRVRPGAIRDIALMTVEGERDDITGLGQTEAAHKLCANLPERMRQHYVQPKVGHYGIFNGRRWREHILPRVRAFILEHNNRAVDGQLAEAPRKAG